MIGDLALKLKKAMCIHDYDEQTKVVLGIKYTKYTCKKCGRVRL